MRAATLAEQAAHAQRAQQSRLFELVDCEVRELELREGSDLVSREYCVRDDEEVYCEFDGVPTRLVPETPIETVHFARDLFPDRSPATRPSLRSYHQCVCAARC